MFAQQVVNDDTLIGQAQTVGGEAAVENVESLILPRCGKQQRVLGERVELRRRPIVTRKRLVGAVMVQATPKEGFERVQALPIGKNVEDLLFDVHACLHCPMRVAPIVAQEEQEVKQRRFAGQ
jgi:hypothetical protein